MLEEASEISGYGFTAAARDAAAKVKTIDRLCTLLILREQPVSGYLRFITLCNHVSLNLGRIAHLCLDLSRTLEKIRTDDFVSDLLNMCVLAEKQFTAAMQDVMDVSYQKNADIEYLMIRLICCMKK